MVQAWHSQRTSGLSQTKAKTTTRRCYEGKKLKEQSVTNLHAVALLQVLGHGFDHSLKKEPGIL